MKIKNPNMILDQAYQKNLFNKWPTVQWMLLQEIDFGFNKSKLKFRDLK